MANVHKHRQRVIRGADDQLWEDLDTVTKAAGADRSAVTREFWEWYVRRPGAELPKRPAQEPEPGCLTVDDLVNVVLEKKRVEDLTAGQREALEATVRAATRGPASSEETSG